MPDWVQRLIAVAALVVSSPLLVIIAVAVKVESDGPIFFASTRIGCGGRPFTMLKFRTMAWAPTAAGPRISAPGDGRLTRMGGVLRQLRLDELPQLWNVARGEMRLVGPRPEDPAFVDTTDARWATVLAVRPGITGLAQLAFHDEADALDANDPETTYRDVVLPRKLAVDAAYVRKRAPRLDLEIILATIRLVVIGGEPGALVDRVLAAGDWRLPNRRNGE